MAAEINNSTPGIERSEQEQIRLDKLSELRAAGKDPFTIVRFDQTHHSREILDGFDALEGRTVSVAGRIMSKRVMGSRVTVREASEEETETYEIVGSQEANPMAGRISDESPLGRSLMGHIKGDVISCEAPVGVLHYEIVDIRN